MMVFGLDNLFGDGGNVNPYRLAKMQRKYNRQTAADTARLNRIDEYNPFGSSTYEIVGEVDGVPQYQRTTSLSPEQQQLLDQQQLRYQTYGDIAQDQSGVIRDTVARPLPAANADVRDAAIDSLYGDYTARMDPRFSDMESDLESKLATQGITQGSEAYDREMRKFNQYRDDAYRGALTDAVRFGGEEMSRLFGLEAAARQIPFTEAGQLFGMSGDVTLPQYNATPNVGVAGVDVITPVMQDAKMQADQRQAAMNAAIKFGGDLIGSGISMMGAPLGGAGGASAAGLAGGAGGMASGGGGLAAAALSDERAKTGMREVGELKNGLPVYAYRMRSGGPTQIGLKAQDVEKMHPAAVAVRRGFKTVNYDKAVR